MSLVGHEQTKAQARRPDTSGHAPTLESAMADFRRAWDSPQPREERA